MNNSRIKSEVAVVEDVQNDQVPLPQSLFHNQTPQFGSITLGMCSIKFYNMDRKLTVCLRNTKSNATRLARLI